MKHSLYGVKSPGVGPTADALEGLLHCTFQERESDYFGVYRMARTPSLVVKVVSQPDPEGELLEEGFGEYRTLVYVDSDSTINHLDGFTFALGRIEKLRAEDC